MVKTDYTHLHETPTNDVAEVVNIGMKGVAEPSMPTSGGGRIAIPTRFVQNVSRGILARQSEAGEEIARGPLRPGVLWRLPPKIKPFVKPYRVIAFGVHRRGIEHDIIGLAIPGKSHDEGLS
jgi:hypothetical protein